MKNSGPARTVAIRYFGDYVLLGEIARGGMGVVYRALQTSLDREVAIKMLDSGRLVTEASLQRFQTEAEAMAKLDHPNIVSIFEIGELEGHCYIAMKLVDGPNLAEYAGNKPMAARTAAELLVTIARAVQYAHEHGVLHRDLKPTNILLNDEGKPHITDFGIAKLAERGMGFTGSVATLGTPEYMSPEQAVGESRHVGPAADIYSLGAVLYHLLAGQAPFKGGTPLEVLDGVLRKAPTPIHELNLTINPLLETICLKCLEKKPSERYRTAGDLASELEKFLSGQTVEPGTSRPVKQTAGRKGLHPAAMAAVGLLLLAVIGGIIYWGKWGPEHATVVSVSNSNQVTKAVGGTNQPAAAVPAKQVTNVIYMTRSKSGIVRERKEETAEGEQTQFFSLTGRLQKNELLTMDGTRQTTLYDPKGNERREEDLHMNGDKEITTITFDRNGNEHEREILKFDLQGRPFEKITVKQWRTVLIGIVTNYFDSGHFGFVYRPVDALNLPPLTWWNNEYWFTSNGTPISHPFDYKWTWADDDWCRHYHFYWMADGTYASPVQWLGDWLLATYLADDYATSASAMQLRKEVESAREELEKSKRIVESTKDLAEMNEARSIQANTELRLKNAEAKAAKAEAAENHFDESRPEGNKTRVNRQIKEKFENQLQKMITAKKKFAERLSGGQNPPPPDLFEALANPDYVYLVSRTFSIATASDSSPAGVLTSGDVLKLEPDLKIPVTGRNENTFVAAKVLASKEDEVAPGTSIIVSLRELQEFDSELRARLDLGLSEAEKNRTRFLQPK